MLTVMNCLEFKQFLCSINFLLFRCVSIWKIGFMIGLEALTTCFLQACTPHHQVKCFKQTDLHSAMQYLFALVNVEIQARVKRTL